MKLGYIVALLIIVLMVGCAKQEEPAALPPAETPLVPEAQETPPLPEAPAEEEPAVVEGDIAVTSAGFDPAEMTVTVGTTLAIKSAEGKHKFTIAGTTTPIVEEGTAYDVTFDKAGEVRIFDIFTKKSAYITVTEEAME